MRTFAVAICALLATSCIRSPPGTDLGGPADMTTGVDAGPAAIDMGLADGVLSADTARGRDASVPDAYVDASSRDASFAGTRQRVELDSQFGTHIDFPVAVPLPTGTDTNELRFVDTIGNVLVHEIEEGQSGTWAWVLVPEIPQTDPHFFLEHVGSGIAVNLWQEAGFRAVYHLADSAADSANQLDGTALANPRNSSGAVGQGVNTEQGGYSLPTDPAFIVDDNDLLTVELWLAANNLTPTEPMYPLYAAGFGVGWFVEVRQDGTMYVQFGVDDQDVMLGSTMFTRGISVPDSIIDGAWHYLVFTLDRGTDEFAVYLDGEIVEMMPLVNTDNDQGAEVNVVIGAAGDESNPWLRRVDEIRFSESIRDEAYISAMYGMVHSFGGGRLPWVSIGPPEPI